MSDEMYNIENSAEGIPEDPGARLSIGGHEDYNLLSNASSHLHPHIDVVHEMTSSVHGAVSDGYHDFSIHTNNIGDNSGILTPQQLDSPHFSGEAETILGAHASSANLAHGEDVSNEYVQHENIDAASNGQLEVSNSDIKSIQEQANGIERAENNKEISFGKKLCATRGGCQGATDCNYSYGSYPG